jgi:plasmid replication initiation protein
MARTPRVGKPRPLPLEQITHFDEANVGRLGLISVQERISDSYVRWNAPFEMDGNEGEIICTCSSEVGGVPHGLDGDFATVLNVLYLEQGAPEDGVVHATAYSLLQRAGFQDSSYYYEKLNASLERLREARYRVSRAWKRPGRKGWDTVDFNYISQIESSTAEGRTIGQGTVLSIKLGTPITASIRHKYLRPLDLDFLVSLKRPLTRALYRLLNAVRQSDDPTVKMREFQVSVQAWAESCKLQERETSRIRRNLEDAHQELIERGFLTDVRSQGRGAKATLTYVFNVQATTAARTLLSGALPTQVYQTLEQMRGFGVTLKAANALVEELGIDHVEARVSKFERMISAGYKPRSRSAVVIDVVRDTKGKYAEPLLTADGGLVLVVAQPQTSEDSPLEPSPPVETIPPTSPEDNMDSLPLLEQAARTVATLRVILGKRASDPLMRAVRVALEEGRERGSVLLQEATKAAFEKKLEGFHQRLLGLEGDYGPERLL